MKQPYAFVVPSTGAPFVVRLPEDEPGEPRKHPVEHRFAAECEAWEVARSYADAGDVICFLTALDNGIWETFYGYHKAQERITLLENVNLKLFYTFRDAQRDGGPFPAPCTEVIPYDPASLRHAVMLQRFLDAELKAS